MGLTSNTGLLAAYQKTSTMKPQSPIELKCEVSPAPFVLRPYAGLYNPFSYACSILCNHPADTEAKEVVKRAKDAWTCENKINLSPEEIAALQATLDSIDETEKPKHTLDLVTEDMFRRYTDTDSRPLTPAPTLASGKSRGSRRCLTPDQIPQKTSIILDLRRSHSQETLYYHGGTTSDITSRVGASSLNDSTLPSINTAETSNARLLKGNCEQLPPLASPLLLSKRAPQQIKDAAQSRTARNKNQLKALHINKQPARDKGKAKSELTPPAVQCNDECDGSEGGVESEVRRRGRRRRKARQSSGRLTSAGLVAQPSQDPETQIAGIGTDSHNPSSRGSIAPNGNDESLLVLPVIRGSSTNSRQTDSFLDADILKYLHREVDRNAVETEFNAKRRFILEEAMRTRPVRVFGQEMQTLLKEMKVPAVSLGSLLHIPRVFSRQNAQFTLPIDSKVLETLSPMKYISRYITFKKSKQLLYLTVLQKCRPGSYDMPVDSIKEGLLLMMGGCFSNEQANKFEAIMKWEDYEDDLTYKDEFRLTLPNYDIGDKDNDDNNETENEITGKTIRFRTWCGLCAICERMHGRFSPRERDPPDGMELSDFSMLETKLAVLRVDPCLVEVLHAIRTI